MFPVPTLLQRHLFEFRATQPQSFDLPLPATHTRVDESTHGAIGGVSGGIIEAAVGDMVGDSVRTCVGDAVGNEVCMFVDHVGGVVVGGMVLDGTRHSMSILPLILALACYGSERKVKFQE
jgi:hypothetical protein